MGGLGMPEIMVILVIALIVFGPRKLPDLGKSLGKAMGQFRRASEDFKRTWEQEVEVEKTKTAISAPTDSSSVGSDHSYHDDTYHSDYGYNAPSDADVAVTDAAPNEAVTAEVATPTTATTTPSQAGQWI